MVGNKLVALEVRSRLLLLELLDVLYQIAEAMALPIRVNRNDVVSRALPEQTLPFS